MNDIETDSHTDGLISSNNDELTKNGSEQALLLAEYLHTKISKIDLIFCSDAPYIRKLVHHIRSKSKSKDILKSVPQYTESLRERNFGVLTGSRYIWESDLFKHTRICAENGESISQCRHRVMKMVNYICTSNHKKTILIISHPFICQIISNVIFNKDHTIISSYWMSKCSFSSFNFKINNHRVSKWKFMGAHNAVDRRAHTEEELYSRIS